MVRRLVLHRPYTTVLIPLQIQNVVVRRAAINGSVSNREAVLDVSELQAYKTTHRTG